MAVSKRLRNVDNVRGTHTEGAIGGPPVKSVVGAGPSGDRVADGTEASETAADTLNVVNFGMGDIRGNDQQLITLSSFGGTDSFTITNTFDHGPAVTTAAFVRGTNATAAAIQAAERTATGDALLLVTGATDEGPFRVIFSGRASDSSGNRRNIPTLSINGTGATGVVTTPGLRWQLGETVFPVITGPGTNGEITTDAVGPAAGGIDVNYTIGAYTGVQVVVCADGVDPDTPIAAVFDTTTPARIEAADFDDGVGPGAGAAVDVYVRGYLLTDPVANLPYYEFGPWAEKVDGTTA